jgi:uncharacterized protein
LTDATPLAPSLRPYFDRGVAAFDEGRFFEAHEHWEDGWRKATGEDRLFLHALIQAAAALHHRSLGNDVGAAALRRKATEKIERLPPRKEGVDLRSLSRLLAESTGTQGGGAAPLSPKSPNTRP